MVLGPDQLKSNHVGNQNDLCTLFSISFENLFQICKYYSSSESGITIKEVELMIFNIMNNE